MNDYFDALARSVAIFYQLGSLILAACGIRLVLAQLKRNRQSTKSQIIMALSGRASEFTKLLHKMSEDQSVEDAESVEDTRDFLRFLETVMLLVSEETISPEEVFPSMGYRVFEFMNNTRIREQVLFVGGRPSARHCGAYALYERLFQHFVERFSDLRGALEDYKLKDYEKSIYWEKSFAEAVSIYYLHKNKEGLGDIKQRVNGIKRLVDARMEQR